MAGNHHQSHHSARRASAERPAHVDEATQPLLGRPAQPDATDAILGRLYTSHLLSTGNSRVFEFGAVLYLATLFPATLLPVSAYAASRGLAAVLVAPRLGRLIDSADRLPVVRWSIVLQRVAVALSCLVMWAMLADRGRHAAAYDYYVGLPVLAVLACVEKLAAILNLVAVERDWVVEIARHCSGGGAGGTTTTTTTTTTAGDDILGQINAQMRRIDLACKLLGPFLISVVDAAASTPHAIELNFALNLLSVGVEYGLIRRVYASVPALQVPKPPRPRSSRVGVDQLSLYVHHPAFRASFACALLYFTVLSFSGQMTTYLLAADGLSSVHVALARTASVAVELSATWLAPLLMARIGPLRAASWFLNWQLACLTVGVGVFWLPAVPTSGGGGGGGGGGSRPISLVTATILSRVGLWGFDLCSQIIVQEEVEPGQRGAFSAVEAAAQNGLELLSYACTLYFARPSQFRWPALLSLAAVYAAAAVYASFLRSRRGHLLHLDAAGRMLADLDCRKPRPADDDDDDDDDIEHDHS